jgi:predicted kinase
MNQEIIITVGLPGSGKSTWAKQFVLNNPSYIRVNRDDLRRMFGKYDMPEREKLVTLIEDHIIAMAIGREYNVVIDATNFNNKYKNIKSVMGRPVSITIQDFTNISLEECIRRDYEREHSVGEGVICRMYNQYLNPEKN